MLGFVKGALGRINLRLLSGLSEPREPATHGVVTGVDEFSILTLTGAVVK